MAENKVIPFLKFNTPDSRDLSQHEAGEPPPTLFDYIPENALLIIDESHVTVPQLGAMYHH